MTARVYRSPDAGPDGRSRPELVVVGAASRDIVADDTRGWRLGGGATYGSLAAARLGLRVGCVLGLDGPGRRAAELNLLAEAGVDVHPVPLERGPVFENIERDGHRVQRWISDCERLTLDAVPASWRRPRAWLLAPVAGEIDDEWAAVRATSELLAVGWQGLLRTFDADGFVHRRVVGPSKLVARADLVGLSVDDVGGETSLADLRTLAPEATIVLTAAAGGGIVLGATGARRYPAVPARGALDPTGAGDVFLAALLVAWLSAGAPPASARALRFAATAAACTVERAGLLGVPWAGEVARLLAGRTG